MTMSKLTDFYIHKASLREEGKPTDPNWEQLEDQLLPQCFLLPRLWESKGTRIDTRIERKKLSEVLRQRIGGVDDIQPITNDSKNEIGALRSCGRLRNEGVARMTRHQRTYTQCPVQRRA